MQGGRAREPFWAQRDRRLGAGRDERERRRARRVGAMGFMFALALPIVLWHRVVAAIASEFRIDVMYLVSEWLPWVLIAGGLAFLAPVAWSAGSDPDSRWYPRARNAYAGWGISLYLLGLALGAQVAVIAGGGAP